MRVFIIGGTSGIGLALAWAFHHEGAVVGVCGRNLDKLPKNVPFQSFQADVLCQEKLEEVIRSFIAENQLDIIINCAGSYAEDVTQAISYEATAEMLQTNIIGTIHSLEIGRKIMTPQRTGCVVVITSVSGTLEYPKASLYAKTKRSAIQIADAYRRALSPFGVAVVSVAPGYVDTQKLRELNQNDLSKKPFLISEEEAVREILWAIKTKKPLHIFPKKMKYLMLFLSFLPQCLLNKIMYKKAQWMKQE